MSRDKIQTEISILIGSVFKIFLAAKRIDREAYKEKHMSIFCV